MPPWTEWLLDISFGTDEPCFVPYNRADDTIVFGMNVLTDKCPGKLVGVIHSKGQAAVMNWCADNPDWYERYSREEATDVQGV